MAQGFCSLSHLKIQFVYLLFVDCVSLLLVRQRDSLICSLQSYGLFFTIRTAEFEKGFLVFVFHQHVCGTMAEAESQTNGHCEEQRRCLAVTASVLHCRFPFPPVNHNDCVGDSLLCVFPLVPISFPPMRR